MYISSEACFLSVNVYNSKYTYAKNTFLNASQPSTLRSGLRNKQHIIFMAVEISLEKLISVGAHFGHQMRRSSPRMQEYMHGTFEGVFVFDLIKTNEAMEEAFAALTNTIKEGKTVLIVGTKKQAKEAVIKMAKEVGIFYVTERWLGGTFTNFNQVKRSVQKLNDIKKNLEAGAYNNYTKKERLLLAREAEKLERMVGGLTGMDKIPDMVIVIDTHREKTAIDEASRLKVPTIGIVDSNGDPADVTYAIPMNDDASGSVEYVISLIADAVKEGRAKVKPETSKLPTEKKEKKAKKEVKATEETK